MKRIISVLLLVFLAAALISCGSQSNDESVVNVDGVDETSVIVGETSERDFSENSIANVFSEVSDNVGNTDNNGDTQGDRYEPSYGSFGKFAEAQGDKFGTLLKVSELESVLDIVQFLPIENLGCYYVSTKIGGLEIYPLLTEEAKERVPYWGGLSGEEQESVVTKTVYTDAEEYAKSEQWNSLYKYTKEGVDMYVVYTRYNDSYDYSIAFRIGDYCFNVLCDKNMYFYMEDRSLPTPEVYEKAKPMFENNVGFYEVADFSHDKSELVRILKELVAEAENGGAVTE